MLRFLPLLLFLFSCTRNSPVAKVGDYTLSEKDAAYRSAVIKIYFPDDNRNLGLDQLVRAYTYAQILKNHGHEITPELVQKEDQRIDKNTAAPDSLAKIKGVFGNDKESYLKDFVFPTLAERTIFYDFFSKDPSIHKESREAAQIFLNTVLTDPKAFSALAAKQKRSVGEFWVSLTEGLSPVQKQEGTRILPNAPPEVMRKMEGGKSELGQKWVEEIIRPLKPGNISPKVIEEQEQYMVVRYSGPVKGKPNTYLMQSVRFPKADYGKWLREESQKVSVTYLLSLRAKRSNLVK